MKHLSGYPKWFHHALIFSLLAVAISGCLMIPTLMEFKLDMDVSWRLDGAQRVWVAGSHTLISWFLLMQTGALWHAHMRAGWRKKLNRVSGVSTALALVILAITAGGLLYLGTETALNAAAITHTVIGILLIGLIIFHMLMGRIIYAKSHQKNK